MLSGTRRQGSSDKNYVRAKRRALGVCINCGEETDGSRCPDCRRKDTDSVRRWRLANRERSLAARRRLSVKYVSEGRCPRCGMELDEDADAGMVICINCRQRVSIRAIGGGYAS